MAEPQTPEQPITPGQTKEVIVKEVLGDKSPAKDAAVQKRIEELQALEPRSMLEHIQDARVKAATEQEGEKEINDLAKRGEKVAEEGIGWNVDTEGKKHLETGEQGRLKDVNERTKDINDYLTTDFDKLSSKQKESAKGDVEKMLRGIPEFDNFLKDLPEKGKSVAISNLLKNPEFRAVVKGIYEGTLNTSEASNYAIKERVEEANEELLDRKKESEQKHAEYLGKDVKLKDVSEQLKQFEDNTATGGGKGKLLEEREGLLRDRPQNEAEIEKRRVGIVDIDKQVDDLGRAHIASLMTSPNVDVDKFEAEMDELNTKQDRLEKEKSRYEAKIDRIDQLRDKRDDLIDRKGILTGERDILVRDDNDAKSDEIDAQTALDEVKAEKATEEQKFVNELKNTFRDSVGEFVEIKAALVEEKNAEIVGEKEATDEFGKNFKNALNDRGMKDKLIKEGAWPWPGRKTRETKVPDINAINADFSKLLQEGPDGVMKDILTSGICGLTPEQADAKMQDKEFMDRERQRVIDTVIGRKFQTGQITGAEAMYIANSDWGQGAIKRGIEKSKEIQGLFKELSANGTIKGSTPSEWTKELAKSNKTNSSILTLLFSLMLLPVLGVKALGDTLKESYNSSTAL
ncbi:hypothetical protein KJ980_01650 [Patescibacteria group bacterium]|nr:hypothetical protein [Patescibacteria group bacterium]MBU4016287.1 hypothetical protein [Patescibacteria group bacterium]MBU4098332.1 hypothetical protein [Patescibacteria group bacterium]